MVKISAGEFVMGSNDGDSDEKPVHSVYLDAFYIDKYEVTNKQYREFVEATGHREPDYWNNSKFNKPTQPVVGVSWHDAVAYAEWAGKRLPTEAEWEKAARGGLPDKRFPWGDEEPNGTQCNFDDKNTHFPWSDKGADDGYRYTAPVGHYPSNSYGLHDLGGNVWEWCHDGYDEDYYANSPPKNPHGSHNASDRVGRGGSWYFTVRSPCAARIVATTVRTSSIAPLASAVPSLLKVFYPFALFPFYPLRFLVFLPEEKWSVPRVEELHIV